MGILLHRKHGLNPTMNRCFYCLEHKDILLVGAKTQQFKDAGLADSDGRMHMDIGVTDMEPCQKCAGHMKQGIILISIREPEKSMVNDKGRLKDKIPNPYRTGGWVVVKEDAIEKMIINKDLVDYALKVRWLFIVDEVWDALQIPRGDINGQEDK